MVYGHFQLEEDMVRRMDDVRFHLTVLTQVIVRTVAEGGTEGQKNRGRDRGIEGERERRDLNKHTHTSQ